MRRSIPAFVAVATLAALLAGFVTAADAQTPNRHLEAARKEGKVVWYTSLVLPSAERVAKLFETAYPDVKVEVHRTGSQRILQRVMQELQANIKNVDVVHTSDAGHYVLLKEKNLLDPKWKGKMVTAHPGYSGVIATHVLALVHLHGWDYFKQLAQNQLMLVQSANDPSTVVTSGERVVAVNGGDYSAYQLKKKGNPIEIVYPKEGVPLVVSPTAITSFAPHPSAARLFTDFTFTREVQQVMADSEGLYTGHPDVTYPADKPKLKDLKLLTVTPEELEKRNEELKKRFVEFFGA